jgi:hypothetical protein
MGSEPSAEEWEQTFGADLLPHLVPAGQPRGVWQPPDEAWLPAGAQVALTDSIGRHGLDDLLVIPGVARAYGRLRRRCLYTPLCILGVGDRAVALWAQTLPAPGIRAVVPLSEIAAIATQTHGERRQLLITGCTSRLPARYDAAGDVLVDALVRRLRRRAAGDPAPVPADYPRPVDCGRRRTFDTSVLRLDADDEVATVGRYASARRKACLLVITSRELVVLRSERSLSRLGRLTDSLYVPRHAVEGAGVWSGSLLLHSSGLELSISLGSRRTAAAASARLEQVLGGHDHSSAGS